jgi:hypothetical protein
MEAQPAQTTPPDRRVKITVPEELLTSLRTTCAEKAKVSLLGRIQGKHPGHKALTAWARDTLHPSLTLLATKPNKLFEISFSEPEGKIHALTQTDLICDTAVITFSSWKLHYTAHTQQQLDFPIWLQVVDLCHVLRDDTLLRTIGAHIGQVITVDNSEAYSTKLYGPRIRLLVRDINNLPLTILLPRLDEEGEVEYNLEYSGLPTQCGRCRSLDHPVRYCPRKDPKFHKREQPARPPQVDAAPNTGHLQPERQRTTTHRPGAAETRQGPIPQKLDFLTETPKTTNTGEAHTPDIERPTTAKENGKEQEAVTSIPPELLPNETNFPQLSSPGIASVQTTPQQLTTQQPGTPHKFIWRKKPNVEDPNTDKGKGKLKTPAAASVPLTRQGYRSGRLADDFWDALNLPNTPVTARKKLRILPLLTKNQDQTEHLVDTSQPSHTPITIVHVAELLAGVPWTPNKVRQHIVTEVSQALHKVLIFNNQSTSPIYKWEHGNWFSQWTVSEDGEHLCTLYVTIAIPESKLKIRKGKALGWRSIPAAIHGILSDRHTEEIQKVGDRRNEWQEMSGLREVGSSTSTTEAVGNTPSSAQATEASPASPPKQIV